MIKQGTTETMYYVETDNLGSVISLLNADGTYAEKYLYDAWGRRRNPASWTYNSIPSSFIIDRGFCGHEYLDNFGLINMNGRMYDPYIGRFLGVDPFIQSTDNSQSFNRYSYCLNNPLKYSDPSGMLLRTKEEMSLSSYDNRYFDISGEFANQSIGGGQIGGDFWDNFQDAVNNGFKGSIDDFQNGRYRKNIKLDDGSTIQVVIIVKPYNANGEVVQTGVRVFGKPGDYNYIQTYSLSDVDSPKTYLQWTLDKGWDYNKGFYYTQSQINQYSDTWYTRGALGYFEDSPNRVEFNAELTICRKDGNYWNSIGTFSCGYNQNNQVVTLYFRTSDHSINEHQNNVSNALQINNSYENKYPNSY